MTDQQTVSDSVPEHGDVVPEAASRAFDSACDVRLRPAKGEGDTDERAISIVFTASGAVHWSAFVTLPESTATKVAETFTGFDVDFDSEDMPDVLGELANLLAARMQTLFTQRELRAKIAHPATYRSESVQALIDEAAAQDLQCFHSPLGHLWTGLVGLG